MSSPWFVVVTEPQQEYPTVWRCHLLGLEVFTPVIRRRIRTGRVRNGHAITRLVARPMFPSYGFVRQTDVRSIDEILAMRGVRDFLRNERDELATLPHDAILAVYAKQQEIHDEFLAGQPRTRREWKRGDRIKIDAPSPAYAGLVAPIDRIDPKGRVEVMLGMIRHSLPADMVVAA
jgi:transcription antitermination factor NusG